MQGVPPGKGREGRWAVRLILQLGNPRRRRVSAVWSGSGSSAKQSLVPPSTSPPPQRSELGQYSHWHSEAGGEKKKKRTLIVLLLVSLGLGLDASQKTCSCNWIITKNLSFFNSGNIFEKTGLNEREWDVRTPGDACNRILYSCFLEAGWSGGMSARGY